MYVFIHVHMSTYIYMPVWTHSNLYRFLLFCFCFEHWGVSLVLCMKLFYHWPSIPSPFKNLCFETRSGLTLYRCTLPHLMSYIFGGDVPVFVWIYPGSSSVWGSHLSHQEVCCVYAPV